MKKPKQKKPIRKKINIHESIGIAFFINAQVELDPMA